MKFCKRVIRLLVFLLGFIGVVASVVAIVGTWMTKNRLEATTESVFDRIDDTLVLVHGRVEKAQDRVEASKISGEWIENALKDWTKRETRERLVLRLEVAEKTERLASTLGAGGRLVGGFRIDRRSSSTGAHNRIVSGRSYRYRVG